MAWASISPYQDTQVWDKNQLLQQGYVKISPQSYKESALCGHLMQTVETIKTFFWTNYKLVGADDQGKIPPFFIHLERDNAYYHPKTPEHPEIFNFNDNYVLDHPEIVCHEFTHAVIENVNPLGNRGEAGAINESIADVVGIVFRNNVYGKKDWNIVNRDLSNQFTIKDLKETNPKCDRQGKTTNDNGNVHHNSCLLSHGFYLASKDLAKSNGDPGNKLLLKIWWESFNELEEKDKDFKGFAKKTIEIGYKELNPIGETIKKAWFAVGFSF
ncbi:MAG: M4 family metallopeptidase [Chlamydiae bacterium]|nr:M4 family metallopeptidase [Chlamydiota bacterium]